MRARVGLLLACIALIFPASARERSRRRHKPFVIFAFVPYSRHVQDGAVVQGRPPPEFWQALGVRPIDLVYEERLLDYPGGHKEAAVPDREKIEAVARAALQEPGVPVSLDMESWNRFDTAHTPARIIEVLQLFRAINQESPLGLYATVPQNTYARGHLEANKYATLNRAYAPVAKEVSYFSPSLYNYSGRDLSLWRDSARFNLAQARRYGEGKPIYAYLTPEIGGGAGTRWLSEKEMEERLDFIEERGADGCIVWASSQSRDEKGEPPVLDPRHWWLKAVAERARRR
jgi:hypothetical protein